MRCDTVSITLIPSGKTLEIPRGETLFAGLAQAGLPLRSDCGGAGKCGKCRVQTTEAPAAARTGTGRGESRSRDALACRTRVLAPMAIEVPLSSLAPAEAALKPDIATRLLSAALGSLPPERTGGFSLAVDLGTTTVAAYLFDHANGRMAAGGAARNPQTLYGDDVIQRIHAASRSPVHLESLRQLALEGINRAVEAAARRAGVEPSRILRAAVVGNPAMMHLFLGVNPAPLGTFPYEPVIRERVERPAGVAGIAIAPGATVRIPPPLSGFIGSDLLAAAAACHLESAAPGTLLIDLGTNGEMILKTGSGYLATSCAAGPALEGAALSCGMPAVSGAVRSVAVDRQAGRLHVTVIQEDPTHVEKPRGICGSGAVSAVAALRRAGVLDAGGRFNGAATFPGLQRDDSGRTRFVLATDTASGTPLALTQADIRAVQLAKAAVASGIRLLCREAALESPSELWIAGAFGHFLDPEAASAIGLIPEMDGVPIETTGNAAGLGALLSLVDPGFDRRLEALRSTTQVFDLAALSDFQTVFVQSLRLP